MPKPFDFSKITFIDELKLRRLLKQKRARDRQENQENNAPAQDLDEFYVQACLKVEALRQSMPKISYPESLPVSSRKDEIVEAVKTHQVVIVAGETGSGKTTQLPKMCLEAGLGLRGMIGHTQPRRIAARAVAARIAEELEQSIGQSVGYKVRFSDQTGPDCLIKLMTDGILLSEIASDRLLLNYSCIIIDEAHERSLNIDFLLGYLKGILKVRPDLKLIITSATIDVQRFSEHFDNAPVIEVSGRTYPVQIVYRPLLPDADTPEDDDLEQSELDLEHAVLKAFHYVQDLGRGDVLVFLPGEREIMDMAAFLNRSHLKETEVVPLYARLATSEQQKIFTPHTGVRIVLATNVAETSLTVPYIKYVIDPGTARISRYSARTKVQRLPIEPVSQASANQRAGRCGRVMDGVCVRLYSKSDFEQRPLYTDPEILRTNLASVILQMIALRLGDIRSFPFIDPPHDRQITDGLRLLDELGAIEERKGQDEPKLTQVGRSLSAIKADPRLGRMLLEGSKFGALSELLIICSALAVMDPRERPLDKKEQSTQLHARFNDEQSDFLAYLKLYEYISSLQQTLSNSALRRTLKREFISYLRVREWFDVLRQLRATCKALGLTFNTEDASYESIHKSILSGLLSQMGCLDVGAKAYTGARGIKFVIHPGSSLSKKTPKWICAQELSETTRLFARTVAVIDPGWAETAGAHLTKKHYHDMHWSKNKGAVEALLDINLYGLVIVKDRRVLYTQVDKPFCRELLIREGLVNNQIIGNFEFLRHNLALVKQIEDLEDKLRKRDVLKDETALCAFYDARLPSDIISVQHLKTWWNKVKTQDPKILDMSFEDAANYDPTAKAAQSYPSHWQYGGFKLKLSYKFSPGEGLDGVSVHLPVTIINQINPEIFAYQIPGLRLELFSELIRSLPKRLRRNLIPAPQFAQALMESLDPPEGNLYVRAARELTRMGGELVEPDDFDLTAIPEYLRLNFVIEDLKGKILMSGKNFAALASQLQGHAEQSLQEVLTSDKRASKPSVTWNFGQIEQVKITRQGSLKVKAYPALSVHKDAVRVELFDSPQRQQEAMLQGTVKLLLLSIKTPTAYLEEHLPNKAKLAMYYQALGTVHELIDDLVRAALIKIIGDFGGPAWDQASFTRLLNHARANLNEEALQMALLAEKSLMKAHELKRLLKGNISFEAAYAYSDIQRCLDRLVFKGFVSFCGVERLNDLPRYLQALIERLKKSARDLHRDRVLSDKIEDIENKLNGVRSRYQKDRVPKELDEIFWMIEELKVSYFAQTLGVKGPISDKRISHELDRIVKEYPPLH